MSSALQDDAAGSASRGRTSAAVAATAALVAAVALWAVVGGSGGPLAGARTVDTLGTWWFQWWVDVATREGFPVLDAEVLFHPWGKDVLRDTGGNLVDPYLLLPVRRLFGAVAAWNLLYFGVLWTNGLAAGALVRARGASLAATLAAVAVVTAHPYPLYELIQGRPTQALLAPAILALGLADRAFESKAGPVGWVTAVGSGLMLALAGYVYWFGAGFAGLGVAVLAVGRRPGERLGKAAVVALVAALTSAPVVWPLVQALDGGDVSAVLNTAAWFDTLALDLTTAAGDAGVLCTLGFPFDVGMIRTRGWTAVAPALGAVALACTVLSARTSWRWAGVGVLGLALAVGPFPGGLPNPVYLVLTWALPPMERLYWPCRALALTVPVAGLGAAAVVGWAEARSPRLPAWAPWACASIIAFGALTEGAQKGQLPLPTWSPEVPAAWHCLADVEGAVVVLPYAEDHDQLLSQTVHGRPMFGGMNEESLALVPKAHQQLREDNGYVRSLMRLAIDPREQIPWSDEDKSELIDLGYRWIVLRRPAFLDPPGRPSRTIRLRGARHRMRDLVGKPVYQDEDLLIYALDGAALACEPATGAVGG